MNAICGHVVVGVRYIELAYESGKPRWSRFGDRFDTLDYGIDLETSNGEIFSIVWDGYFHQYGLVLQQESIAKDWTGAAVWDVTARSRWRDVLYVPISNVVVHWSWWEEDGARTYYPQDLELRFEDDKRIFLCAAERMCDHDQLSPMSDNVVVIFDDQTAEHYGVGPFRSDEGWTVMWKGLLGDMDNENEK